MWCAAAADPSNHPALSRPASGYVRSQPANTSSANSALSRGKRLRGLWFHVQDKDVRLNLPNSLLHPRDDFFDFGRCQMGLELHAQCDNHLVGCKLSRSKPVRTNHPIGCFGDCKDLLLELHVRALTDEEALAFARQRYRD